MRPLRRHAERLLTSTLVGGVPAASPHLITEPANLITIDLSYLAIAGARARSGQRFNSQFRTEAGVCAPVDPGANHTEWVMAAHPVASQSRW